MSREALRSFFRNRRILLVSARFFGYETRIARHLGDLGAEVHFLDERPGDHVLVKALMRSHAAPPLARWFCRPYFRLRLAALADQPFDEVLIISPECCDERFLRLLREVQPKARLLLYMWDSFANKGWSPRRAAALIAGFDHASTFDDADADRYGLPLRPLFWSAPVPPASDPRFIFSFIGTLHADRYRIVKALAEDAQARGLPYLVHLFLPTRGHYWVYRLLKPEFRHAGPRTFAFAPMPYDQVLAGFQASRAILDVENPGQRGLTMRTLEVLHAGRHLLTTNANIRRYPFYRPDRVTLLDRAKARLPLEVPTPTPLTEAEQEALSLSGWCRDVFQVPSLLLSEAGEQLP